MKLNKEKAQLLSELISTARLFSELDFSKYGASSSIVLIELGRAELCTDDLRAVIQGHRPNPLFLSVRPAYDFKSKCHTAWAEISLENNQFKVIKNSGLTKQDIKKCIVRVTKQINNLSKEVINNHKFLIYGINF